MSCTSFHSSGIFAIICYHDGENSLEMVLVHISLEECWPLGFISYFDFPFFMNG